VVSKEDDMRVTKAYIGRIPLSKEVCVIEDDGANTPDKADNMPGTRKFNNLASL
jgi:hypothetical protein